MIELNASYAESANLANFKPFSERKGLDRSLLETKKQVQLWERRIQTLNSGFVTEFHTYRVAFLTWNVASAKPTSEVLGEISRAFRMRGTPSDMVFVVLQEIDMSVVSVVAGSTRVRGQWRHTLVAAISHQKEPYILAAETSLGGVYAALIIRKAAIPVATCRDVRCIRLGAHGFAANKGGIIFPVTIGAARLVFIGCHLSAHSENWEARNQEVRQLLSLINDKYDYAAIVGDLNYRIELSYEQCVELIREKKVAELISKDQLHITRGRSSDMNRLKEPVHKFMPTFKFDEDSDVYDTSAKKRVPSYTDRVLLARGRKRLCVGTSASIVTTAEGMDTPNFPGMPKCVDFFSGTSRFSDHRSVLCSYKFNIPVVNHDKLFKLTDFMNT